MGKIFISYSRKDLSFIEQLVTDLKSTGHDVWYDVSGISGGSRWRTEIENAIRGSQFVVVVLSPDSIASEWVEREFLFASNLKRKIIPLMYRSCELPLNYLDLNYIDVQRENYAQNFDELLKALNIDATATTLPSSKVRTPSFKLKTEYVIAIIGAVATIFAAVLPFLLKNEPATPLPTATNQLLVITATSILPIEEPELVITPTPSFTPAPILTPTPTPLPMEIVDSRGVTMRLVSAGAFTMGSESGEPDERPAQKVDLDDFYIDKYEVSNKLYKACADAGGCLPPKNLGSNHRSIYYGATQFEKFPVINVTWNMAKAYCEWRGGRLPTEAEWEKAARGPGGNVYPWGNDEPNQTLAIFGNNEADTISVESSSAGASYYGVYNMAGNVWEWVDDWYDVYPGGNPNASTAFGTRFKVIRGGSWRAVVNDIRSSARSAQDLNDQGKNGIGIRCAKDATP